MDETRDGAMSVLEHLAELRRRIAVAAVALLAAAIVCFTRIDQIRAFLTGPLGKRQLIYLSPPEALTANLRLAFIAGALLAAPLILYEAAAFLLPAFTRREKIIFLGVLSGICFFFAGGVVFAYTVLFPFTLDFFLKFASAELQPEFSISEYISFVFFFHLAFGLVFQLPLLTWALGRIGLLSSAFLRRNRKYALLVILILAAIITPPDVISQLVMAGPLLILYEIGIIMVVFSERKRAKELARLEAGV